MKKEIIYFLLIFLSIEVKAEPLGLPWGVQFEYIPKIENFKYFFGDNAWGQLVYTGFLVETDAELHINLSNKYISDAILILGPNHINQVNCIRKYKYILSTLSKKYGRKDSIKIVKDPLMDELLLVSKCHAVQTYLYMITTTWLKKNFRIEATLWGDEGDIYIEISYYYTPIWKKKKKIDQQKLLEFF